MLEVDCDAGIDFVRFGAGRVKVTGIDLSKKAIDMARKKLEQSEQNTDLCIMNGECMQFADNTFDVVYAHGVLEYTADTTNWKAHLFNNLYVRVFNLMPKRWVKPFGWHLPAFAIKRINETQS